VSVRYVELADYLAIAAEITGLAPNTPEARSARPSTNSLISASTENHQGAEPEPGPHLRPLAGRA
jgi:hypothetical protein